MPAGDGTGPMGLGPMTGRAAGYCAGYPVPGYMNPGSGRGWFGRGFGRGWGRGRGRGRGWFGAPFYPSAYGAYPYAPEITAQQEAQMLREQAKAMQEEMKNINDRIKELETAAKKTK